MEESSSSDSESDPLLSLDIHNIRGALHRRLFHIDILSQCLCIPSKTAVLILLWTLAVIVPFTPCTVTDSVSEAVEVIGQQTHTEHSFIEKGGTIKIIFLSYLGFVVASLFYPIAGFVADVHIGRYKAVIISLILLLCEVLCFSCNGFNFVLFSCYHTR